VSFVHALRILINRFRLVWVLALFMLVLIVIVGLLSLSFIDPIVNMLRKHGTFDQAAEIVSMFWEGKSVAAVFEEFRLLLDKTSELFQASGGLVVRTNIMFFVVLAIYKFLLGFYELPMYRVLDGAMSSNAKLGFFNRFVSCLGLSSRFVLVKIIYTTVYDALFLLVLYLLFGLFFSPIAILAPVILGVYVIVFQALRYTLTAFWGPDVGVEGKPIFKSFVYSVKKAGKSFSSVFSSFVVMWIIFIALNLFIGIFTFGAGLIVTVPMCMLFVCILNMTMYYSKTGRRHYVDGEIVTPKSVISDE